MSPACDSIQVIEWKGFGAAESVGEWETVAMRTGRVRVEEVGKDCPQP